LRRSILDQSPITQRERATAVIGTPGQVKERLLEIHEAFEADELMVITFTGDYASRIKSHELLATEFDLDPAARRSE